jgi:lipopolysaccharide export system permease protein
VFVSILHRMILWELAKVFVLSLLAITGILLMAGIVAEASQQGLGPMQILAIIPLLIPSTLPYTIPTTTLFATCVVYGRLSHDNEILAIRAAGVNVLRMIWPAVLLGLAMSAVTLTLYFHVIPYTHHLMRSRFLNDVEELLYGMLRKDKQIDHPKLNYAMWVKRVEGRKLLDATFKRRNPNTGSWDYVVRAKEAELRVDMRNRLVLVHMRYATVYGDGSGTGYLDDRVIEVPLPDILGAERPRRARDLGWTDIFQRRQELSAREEELAAEIALLNAEMVLTQTPGELPKKLAELKETQRFVRLEINALNAELQMRPGLSLGCLCFVLVGCPVGIWLSKSDYLSAFITCFLPIVFLYYPLVLCGTNLAKEGRIHPALSIWAADGLMVVISSLLLRRLLRN